MATLITHIITVSLPIGIIFCCFYENPLFKKHLSEIPPECQTVWIQI